MSMQKLLPTIIEVDFYLFRADNAYNIQDERFPNTVILSHNSPSVSFSEAGGVSKTILSLASQ